MGSCQLNGCLVLVLCLSLFTAFSTSTFISDGIFGIQILSERRLLQAKKLVHLDTEDIWRLSDLVMARVLVDTFVQVPQDTFVKRFNFSILLACPVNFEFQNYTIITSKCKGPQYPPDLCCAALKDFSCPFADDLNDLSNDCASTMFSYINLYGNYPPGLFSRECREGKLGLECPAVSPSAALSDKSGNSNGSGRMSELLPMLILVAASLVLSMQLI